MARDKRPLSLVPSGIFLLLGLCLTAFLGCQKASQNHEPTRGARAKTSSSATSKAPSSNAAGPKPTASGSTRAEAATSARATAAKTNPCSNVQCPALQRCDQATGRCKPGCPKGEVYVPPTSNEGFVMGKGYHGSKDPPHKVILTQGFCMDATEVTVAAYKECVAAKACKKPRRWGMWRNYPKLEKHPMNKVDWEQSLAYCKWRGKNLPSEAQWEWAATGGDGRTWAWGNERPNCKRTDYTPGILRSPSSDDGCHGGGTSPVGSHPDGDKIWPDGRIHDLTGNVWEWCLDNYKPYERQTQKDPVVLRAPKTTHVVRGGGWNRSHTGIRAHYRGGAVYTYKVPGLGFRCVRNAGG